MSRDASISDSQCELLLSGLAPFWPDLNSKRRHISHRVMSQKIHVQANNCGSSAYVDTFRSTFQLYFCLPYKAVERNRTKCFKTLFLLLKETELKKLSVSKLNYKAMTNAGPIDLLLPWQLATWTKVNEDAPVFRSHRPEFVMETLNIFFIHKIP